MVKNNTSKTKTLYTGKKNIDVSNIINNTNIKSNRKYIEPTQLGGSKNKNKNKKKYNSNSDNSDNSDNSNDSESGSDDNDNDNDDDDDIDNNNDDINLNDQDDLDANNNELDNDNQSEENNNSSDDENSVNSVNSANSVNSDDDKDDKNYIDNEETLKSKCYSKYAEQNIEDLDLDEIFGEETLNLNPNIKLSKPILTKYEFVRILTDRTKQLAQGAKPMLKNIDNLSSKEIAKLELKNKIAPIIIERPIPNSNPERWKLSELEIPEHFFSN